MKNKEVINFIKQCDCFFVTTLNNNKPNIRPFGAMMEYKNKLYISTGSKKNVYKQIIKNNHIAISAIKRNTRTWIRFNAVATPIESLTTKKIFFQKCPRLKEIYKSFENKTFKIFQLKVNEIELYQ